MGLFALEGGELDGGELVDTGEALDALGLGLSVATTGDSGGERGTEDERLREFDEPEDEERAGEEGEEVEMRGVGRLGAFLAEGVERVSRGLSALSSIGVR